MSQRLVVNLVGEPAHGRLAESRFVKARWVAGGHANCMQLAFAAAAAGHEVELRGWLHEPSFRRFAAATGAEPQVELSARMPTADDIVVVPEGWNNPVSYLQLSLSPARLVLFVLAAPGLFGWPFGQHWSSPDPLTVDISTLARPEHFRAMRALGFELLTHSPGLVSAAAAGGVDCRLLGMGLPWALPQSPGSKPVDVVAVMANRWAPLAAQVLDELDDLVLDPVEEVGNQEMLRRLARARVLVWPSRVEGHATIPQEARSVGCVPVALDTNPFAVGLDEEHGAVLVREPGQLARAVRALLADRDRLALLAERGRATVREETDWSRYMGRVSEWLAETARPDSGRPARAGAGVAARAAIQCERDEAQERSQERLSEIARAGEHLRAGVEREQELLDRLQRPSMKVAWRLSEAFRRLTRR